MSIKFLRTMLFVVVAISNLSMSYQVLASDQPKQGYVVVCNDISCWSQNRRVGEGEVFCPYQLYPNTVK